MTTLDDLPDTGELIAIADRAYGLTRASLRARKARAVLARDLAHQDQLETYRRKFEAICNAHPGHTEGDGYVPNPTAFRECWRLLEAFGAAWAATDDRYAAEVADIQHQLDALELS